jgi:hypothetical protein
VNHPQRRRGGVFARASGDEAISDAQRAHESTLHAWRAAS